MRPATLAAEHVAFVRKTPGSNNAKKGSSRKEVVHGKRNWRREDREEGTRGGLDGMLYEVR